MEESLEERLFKAMTEDDREFLKGFENNPEKQKELALAMKNLVKTKLYENETSFEKYLANFDIIDFPEFWKNFLDVRFGYKMFSRWLLFIKREHMSKIYDNETIEKLLKHAKEDYVSPSLDEWKKQNTGEEYTKWAIKDNFRNFDKANEEYRRKLAKEIFGGEYDVRGLEQENCPVCSQSYGEKEFPNLNEKIKYCPKDNALFLTHNQYLRIYEDFKL